MRTGTAARYIGTQVYVSDFGGSPDPSGGPSCVSGRMVNVNDYDLHTRAPRPLVADARRKAPGLSLGAVVRLALARLAGWPESAAQSVAGPAAAAELPDDEHQGASVEDTPGSSGNG